LQTSDSYITEELAKNYNEAIEKRKDSFIKNLENKIIARIRTGMTNDNIINLSIQDAIDSEKYYIERFVENETLKAENKAKLKSYEDLGIEYYIVKENKDDKICDKCSE